MEEISVIGIDLAKRVFQVCCRDACGGIVVEKRLGRGAFMRFMSRQAAGILVGLEACGGSHYWGRWLVARGFRVKMMSPYAVKAYVSGAHKSDAIDARAICEAATRSHVGTVRVKSEAAQGLQARVRVRERRVRQLVRASNQFRALLHEFGFVVARGRRHLLVAFDRITASPEWAALPGDVREMLEDLHAECRELACKADAEKHRLAAAAERDGACRLIMSVPHLGPVNASALAAIEDLQRFTNGRAFAAYLGLVPRQQSSGESKRQGGITKHGSSALRRYLVLAAQTLLIRAERDRRMGEAPDRLRQWALDLAGRKHRNVAVTAIAARLARIAWAVMHHQRPYLARPARLAVAAT
jgi:transposase